MRRAATVLLAGLALLATSLVVGVAPPAAAGSPCPGGEVEVRGRIRDAATTLPLDEVTSVEVSQADIPVDGFSTGPDSRYSFCLLPGAYTIKFVADSYRPEFYDDQPDATSATPVIVSLPGPVVVNASLTPRGRVLAGRLTNAAGQPRFGSIGIWRLTSVGWRPIDGIANQLPSGRWSFRVPFVGKYRVSADVDHHISEFWNNKPRLSLATTINVTSATTYISGIDHTVSYCTTSANICQPPGFNT